MVMMMMRRRMMMVMMSHVIIIYLTSELLKATNSVTVKFVQLFDASDVTKTQEVMTL